MRQMNRSITWLFLGLVAGALALTACGPASGSQSESAPPEQTNSAPSPEAGNPGLAPDPGQAYPVEGKNPLEDQPGIGPITIQEKGLIISQDPPQVEISLSGTLPTPCHELKWVIDPPGADGRIEVLVVSKTDPTENCIQVLAPFEERIPLESLPAGAYTVVLNGEVLGDFQLDQPIYP